MAGPIPAGPQRGLYTAAAKPQADWREWGGGGEAAIAH